MERETQRGWTANWKPIGLAIVVAAGCAGALAAFALASSDSEVGVKSITTPEGKRVPISRSVSADSLVYKGKLGDSTVYLADGVGPTAGMVCVVLAKEDITRTACDTPEAVKARGIVLSEDAGPGQLKVDGYLPGGVQSAGQGPLVAKGDFFEGTVPQTQRAVTLSQDGSPVQVSVPGSK